MKLFLKNATMESKDIVREKTSPEINRKIDTEIQENLNKYYHNRSEINKRLWELDREWDIERILELNAAVFCFMGLWRGLTKNKLWFALPVAVSAMLATHAIEGWCPPVTLFRRFGFRTKAEIEKERYALKTLRGDFKYMIDVPNVAWEAVNK
jgi:hypothetical protein